MLSFYVRARDDTFSHIKFGSWDKSKIEKDEFIFRAKTRMDTKDWEIESYEQSGIIDVMFTEIRYLDFDPAFPNTYVPNDDWVRFGYNWMQRVFAGNDNFVLSEQDNMMYWKDTCENLKAKLIKEDKLKYLHILFKT